MVYSSVPAYLDPPNWHQQQQSGGSDHENSQLPPLLPPPPTGAPPLGGGGSGGTTTGKFGSMSERAKLAKIPQPETALKCPRCESTNTKFCYFNNYSLSQPRHFCKTCRRYWTQGGALRSVPVGGCCRRNKRSNKGSSNRSKPSATTRSTSTTTTSAVLSPQPPQLPFFPSLHYFGEYGAGDIGSTFGGGNDISSGKFLQPVQQFPFLEAQTGGNGMYRFEGEEGSGNYVSGGDQFGSKTLDCGVGGIMKMEDLNLSRNFLGISGNDQFWVNNVNTWSSTTDHHHCGFASSSTSHLS